MTKQEGYVVRSMTTTDYNSRDSKPVVPYHVYLMPAHKRVRAYWSAMWNAQVFATPQEAEAEAVRSLTNSDNVQIVPVDDRTIPEFWVVQKMNRDNRAAHKQEGSLAEFDRYIAGDR